MSDCTRILAIETASEACSLALFEDGRMIARDHRVMGRGHAEHLVPMIAALPGKGKADRILVSLGPGSFTGVRIGIATARALGFAWGAEVLGYPTLAAVAAQVEETPGECAPLSAPVTVCMNGGHGEWFIADFGPGAVTNQARSLTPQAAKARGAHPIIAGNRAREFAELLGPGYESRDILPDAGAVTRLDVTFFTQDLTPIYGRGPDATPLAERRAAPAKAPAKAPTTAAEGPS